MKWPPDYNAEAIRRKKLYMAFCSLDDPRKHFMDTYKDDPVAFINDWCWTYDPRNTKKGGPPTIMPFLLFPIQVDLVNFLDGCLEDQADGLIEKCRAMGASWICVAYAVWLWLFKAGTVSGFGSQLARNVDWLGNMDSLIEKVRFTIDRLPFFAVPQGYNPRKHATSMNITNPINNSSIIGGVGDNIGRGGRTSMYFKDESAHYEHPDIIEASLSATTNVQIDISSVNGTGNLFYRKAMGGIARKFIMDWRDHPGQDQAWYDKKKDKAESEGTLHILAQEIDRDYSGSVQGVIIPSQWVKASIDAHIKLNIKIIGAKEAGLDVADEGGDTNSLAIREGILLSYVDEWGEGDTGETAEKAAGICSDHNCDIMRYDSVGVGAGVKADVRKGKERENAAGVKGVYSRITAIPYSGGAKVRNPLRQFSDGKKNQDMFKNLKAQSYWELSMRFYKTYRMIEGKEAYPHDELISLDSTMPKLHKLVNELSQPTRKYDGVGRLMVEKKPDGTKSPNLADSVVMAYDKTAPKIIRMAFN